MKKITKILFVIAIMFIASLTFSVSAQEITVESEEIWGETAVPTVVENKNVSFSPPFESDIVLFGDSVPSNTWSWSNGDCIISGRTANTKLYSNYLFTNATTLNFGFTKAEQSFTLELWSKDTGLFWTDQKVATINIERITAQQEGNLIRIYYASGLNSSTKYYFKILPEATFSGYVRRV